MKWIDAIAEMRERNTAFVLVTVLDVEGSAPRGQQSKMVITERKIFDSIGGGNLEHRAMNKARTMLVENKACSERHRYTLGQDLTQCCGGRVELLFECFPACAFNIVLYGAGHVGKSLIKILAEIPCRVLWLDSRDEMLAEAMQEVGAPANVTAQVMVDPNVDVERCPDGSFFLVMTHSHEIDFELCEAILSRRDKHFCGLIGSRSKASKFRKRLHRKGYTKEELVSLTSPVGLQLGSGKQPMEVAVSIAAQLMQVFNAISVEQNRVGKGHLDLVANFTDGQLR